MLICSLRGSIALFCHSFTLHGTSIEIHYQVPLDAVFFFFSQKYSLLFWFELITICRAPLKGCCNVPSHFSHKRQIKCTTFIPLCPKCYFTFFLYRVKRSVFNLKSLSMTYAVTKSFTTRTSLSPFGYKIRL